MQYKYQTYNFGSPFGLTPAIKWLLIMNTGVYILQMIIPPEYYLYELGLVPKKIHTEFWIWQFVTYMFLHGSFMHLFFNMFGLWMFGAEIERYWGTKEFLKYYFLTGIGAGIFSTIFSWNSIIPTIGASGAIYGILVAFAMVFPEKYIFIYFILPVKAKYVVAGYMVLTFIGTISQTNDDVAHIAHLGGGLIGFLYLKSDWRLSQLWFKIKDYLREKKIKKRFRSLRTRQDEIKQLRLRIDIILDKINQVGYDNLTDEEKRILMEGSKLLSQLEEKN
jgi:membrane associated rhomboid family serine protease